MQISVLSYISGDLRQLFLFNSAICGQKRGHGFLLALFFNAPRLFCDHAPHAQKEGTAAGCLAAPRQGRGAGARWGPRPAAGPLYIFERPGIHLTPDQRINESLLQ